VHQGGLGRRSADFVFGHTVKIAETLAARFRVRIWPVSIGRNCEYPFLFNVL